MSSYYTTAQLEAMRKARLKAELLENLDKIRAQLLEKHQNDVVVSAATNMEITVTNDDEGVSGFQSSVQIGEELRHEQALSSRSILDLSSLLLESHSIPSQMEQEIEKLVDSIFSAFQIEIAEKRLHTRCHSVLTNGCAFGCVRVTDVPASAVSGSFFVSKNGQNIFHRVCLRLCLDEQKGSGI